MQSVVDFLENTVKIDTGSLYWATVPLEPSVPCQSERCTSLPLVMTLRSSIHQVAKQLHTGSCGLGIFFVAGSIVLLRNKLNGIFYFDPSH